MGPHNQTPWQCIAQTRAPQAYKVHHIVFNEVGTPLYEANRLYHCFYTMSDIIKGQVKATGPSPQY